jgi:uncharacterized cupin superfamily protein
MHTTVAQPGIYDPFAVALDPWPIPADQVHDGNPAASGNVIARSEDRRGITGIWECTPGTFDWVYTWDETITVLAGRVTIQDASGTSQTFKTGDVVHFPIGLRATWTVHETVRKFYALLSPTPVDL